MSLHKKKKKKKSRAKNIKKFGLLIFLFYVEKRKIVLLSTHFCLIQGRKVGNTSLISRNP